MSGNSNFAKVVADDHHLPHFPEFRKPPLLGVSSHDSAQLTSQGFGHLSTLLHNGIYYER